MHISDVATICTAAPSYADESAFWADSISPAYEHLDSFQATAQADNPCNAADQTARLTQCSLPSGLGTLTVATCETAILQPWSSREVRVNATKYNNGKRMEPEPKLQGGLELRWENVKSGKDNCMLLRRCRVQQKPLLKPGMTVTEVKHPARCCFCHRLSQFHLIMVCETKYRKSCAIQSLNVMLVSTASAVPS